MFSPAIRVSIGEPVVQLGTFNLKEDVRELGEVVIIGKAPLYEQKIDRMVVNVQSSITLAGNTVLEYWKRARGCCESIQQ